MTERIHHEVFNIMKQCRTKSGGYVYFNEREFRGVLGEVLKIQKEFGAMVHFERDKFSPGKFYDRAKEGKYRRDYDG